MLVSHICDTQACVVIYKPFTDVPPDAVEGDSTQQEHHYDNKDIDSPCVR